MVLQWLLRLHAVVTLAAGFVLIAFPRFIPGSVDIRIGPEAYLLSYFLAAAELSIAFLSFFATKVNDYYALKVIVISFMIFHGVTALLETYAVFQAASIKLVGNIVLRTVITCLFGYFGLFRKIKYRECDGGAM